MQGNRPRTIYTATFATTLAVAISVAFYVGVGNPGGKLTYEVDGSKPVTQGLVETNGERSATLRFSDGTDITLQTDARLRLSSVAADGPRLVLEHGEALVHVFHRDGVQWRFEAGPFLVVVRGTSFVVRWNERDKEFSLHLRAGAVSVSGPLQSGPLQVREGQTLSARLNDGEIVLREQKEADFEAARPTELPTATVPPPPEPHTPSSAPADRKGAENARNWGRKLASGKVAQILTEALAFGLQSVLDEASGADLEALGDAARYSGREDIARSVLSAERRRFANSARATRASFFLGRIEEAGGNWVNASSWYATYLREAPDGPYASEALGGEMAAVQHVHGNERARSVAREYLRRFPKGDCASAARVLLGQP